MPLIKPIQKTIKKVARKNRKVLNQEKIPAGAWEEVVAKGVGMEPDREKDEGAGGLADAQSNWHHFFTHRPRMEGDYQIITYRYN
jgi:hypothetical protein